MKVLFQLLLLVLITFTTRQLSAQQISGQVKDAKGEPVAFATVALHQTTDSALITGIAADLDGVFTLPSPETGAYYLQLSAVGYQPLRSAAFQVSGPSFSKTFDIFIMEENVEMLDEVVVEAMQSQVVSKGDKLVMNVGNTMLATESSAYEVLKEAPGVYADQNGELQLNGKSGIKIMIDGRDTYVTGGELKSMLENMPAKNIDAIEVISNPSAKYDAEGAAGVINIRLTRNEQSGFNGSVYTDYRYNNLHQYSTGANLNYKKGAWSSFANIDLSRSGRLRSMSLYREYHDDKQVAYFSQEGTDARNKQTPSIRLGSDIDLGKQHSLGFTANLSYDDTFQEWPTLSTLTDDDPGADVLIDAKNTIEGQSLDQTYNLHYTAKLDTAGAELSANFDYVRLQNQANSRFRNSYTFLATDAVEREIFTTANPSSYDILAGRLDYVQPISRWNGQLETGAKFSHVISTNNLDFFELVDDVERPMTERFNNFTYLEDIYAAYVSVSSRINDSWSLQAGLRAEYTNSEGRSATLNEVNQRNFFNLFPSVSLQQKVNDNYQISYGYSRRINRPRYSKLNPYVFYLDPYTFVQGNPQLRPQYTHALQITQTINRQYNIMLGYDYSTDFVTELPSIDSETRITVLTEGNVETFRNLSARIVAPLQIGKKWTMNNMISAAYQIFETTIDEVDYYNARLFFSARSTSRIKLPAGFTMELSADYRGPLAHGVYKIGGQWGADAGFQRKVMRDKLSISLRFQDIFRTRRIHGTIGLGENVGRIDQYMNDQSVMLGLRYNFSKGARFENKKRQHRLEELQRVGG